MEYIETCSICKINIGLYITEKRKDGYHNIETIFYPINKLFDNLVFKKSNELNLKCNIKFLNNQDNIIFKAIKALENYTGEIFPVEITLTKNIPFGAGLGGGSSNAAETLKAINYLYELNLSTSELLQIAAKIGADVPFFITPAPTFATGIGDIFSPVDLKIKYPILLVKPEISISTKEAYASIQPQKASFNLLEISGKVFDKHLSLLPNIKNDFENFAFEKYPELLQIKNTLVENGAFFALMSGSGSTIYGIFEDNSAAEKANNLLSTKYQTYIV
ncbi:MAG TPA: 4-(cytidine 5'-diphospho)-2-C-methyl-D-erythritol kinase [Ignavibacteriales bacterium]|nr:4-(cytidine 5'-diphospho)-2-C-methyl-D-erythritol kinase [Ignavibacteriales bacterium]HOL82137.1 4-(cytidine 5'-diphospho)-2-C-methyl-D-erythritol kinase [Ignavibacteriales bacterium]HOM65782.1 4-(cytidine 5'-diphospho)-2-C-methyl-D-erythritol kinase [Ignavibacteriales bacterium]HPD66936.1 4-(cytidine 5'-diphospho)-2-C-methyl-D-erythritol kinase [Ignavibacteriales bacterium]HPP34265.1 4-(cytidine 5'-diphospho)-2-C-methyl-D-erythritol kinase [Ignavibacteriales bacterium]